MTGSSERNGRASNQLVQLCIDLRWLVDNETIDDTWTPFAVRYVRLNERALLDVCGAASTTSGAREARFIVSTAVGATGVHWLEAHELERLKRFVWSIDRSAFHLDTPLRASPARRRAPTEPDKWYVIADAHVELHCASRDREHCLLALDSMEVALEHLGGRIVRTAESSAGDVTRRTYQLDGPTDAQRWLLALPSEGWIPDATRWLELTYPLVERTTRALPLVRAHLHAASGGTTQTDASREVLCTIEQWAPPAQPAPPLSADPMDVRDRMLRALFRCVQDDSEHFFRRACEALDTPKPWGRRLGIHARRRRSARERDDHAALLVMRALFPTLGPRVHRSIARALLSMRRMRTPLRRELRTYAVLGGDPALRVAVASALAALAAGPPVRRHTAVAWNAEDLRGARRGARTTLLVLEPTYEAPLRHVESALRTPAYDVVVTLPETIEVGPFSPRAAVWNALGRLPDFFVELSAHDSDADAFDVFVSYRTRRNRDEAREIARVLAERGLGVWLDERELDPQAEQFDHDVLTETLEEMVASSRCLLLVRELEAHALAVPPYSDDIAEAELPALRLRGALIAWDWQILEYGAATRAVVVPAGGHPYAVVRDGPNHWAKVTPVLHGPTGPTRLDRIFDLVSAMCAGAFA